MNFPDSPSNGDTVTLNGKEYTYETTRLAWTPAAPGAAAGATTLSELTDTTISTTNPAIDSNPTSGLGHTWINKTSGEQYILVVATAGANEWFNVGDGTGRIQPVPPVVATGGTITTLPSGNYRIHTFTSSDTFTFSGAATLAVEYLVVAGGGAGGGAANSTGYGGGGAGGLLTGNLTLSASTTYTATVGAGGAGRSGHTSGNAGFNSVFDTITSIGGGGGNSQYVTNTSSGGSGGGGEGFTASGAGGAGTVGQGNAGGAGTQVSNYGGGGGGGAGAVGGDGPGGNDAGDGGVGLASSITGSEVYYAGGGGGGTGTGSDGVGGAGGLGGGGNGGSSPYTTAGTANTGGGGGAGGYGAVSIGDGSSGGSGVIIIRYAI